jgi:hypothetical protein
MIDPSDATPANSCFLSAAKPSEEGPVSERLEPVQHCFSGARSQFHQIFGAETVAFRKRRSLSWVLVEVTMEACRVSQLCGGNVEKSIERIAVHLLPVDATAGWFRLILCVG